MMIACLHAVATLGALNPHFICDVGENPTDNGCRDYCKVPSNTTAHNHPCAEDGSDYCCNSECTTCGPLDFCDKIHGGHAGVCRPAPFHVGPNVCVDYFEPCEHGQFNEPVFHPHVSKDKLKSITCPFLAIKANYGKLPMTADGVIAKHSTFEACKKMGVSPRSCREAVDSNFLSADCPECPETVNVFQMNTLQKGETAVNCCEHFRSLCARDGDHGPSQTAFLEAAGACLPAGAGDKWTAREIMCFAMHRDTDKDSCDVNEGRRPMGLAGTPFAGMVCNATSTGPYACPSQKYGSVFTLFEELCSHPGPDAHCTKDEWEDIWLRSQPPADFVKRSPMNCMRDVSTSHYGCQDCLNALDINDSNSIEVYCRCIVAQELDGFTLHQLETYQARCMVPEMVARMSSSTATFMMGPDLALDINVDVSVDVTATPPVSSPSSSSSDTLLIVIAILCMLLFCMCVVVIFVPAARKRFWTPIVITMGDVFKRTGLSQTQSTPVHLAGVHLTPA